MSQVLVEVPSLAALGAAKTSAGGEVLSPEQYLDEGWKTGKIVLYFFVRGSRSGSQTEKRLTKIRTRAVLGDLEDPGTGSAASGLGSYLALAEGVDGEYGYEITQGVEMGRQSEIGVSVWVKDRKIEQVQLRGSAVRVMEGRILA